MFLIIRWQNHNVDLSVVQVMTTQLLRLLSASAVRRRERLARAENGFSTSTSTSTRTPSTSTRAPSTSTRTPSNLVTPSSPSPRNVVSAVHLPQKTNSHNKLISQMGHLLANEEGSQKKPSMPPSPRQFTTSRRHPDGGQRLPPWKVYNSDLTTYQGRSYGEVTHYPLWSAAYVLLRVVGSFYFPAPLCLSVIEELLLVITVLSINIREEIIIHLHWWTILNPSHDHIPPSKNRNILNTYHLQKDAGWHLEAKDFRSSSTLNFAHIL